VEYFGVALPGTAVTDLDPEPSYHVQALLALCVDALMDSALALEMFNQALRLRIAAERDPEYESNRRMPDVPGIGSVPLIYLHRLPLIHARTVLYALDGISESLRTLVSTDGVPANVRLASEDFNTHLPTLKSVRDSSHHMADRARGLNKRGQLLNLKPILDGPFKAPHGGVLALNNLDNCTLCMTGNDGGFYGVSITSETLRKAQLCVRSAINSFNWIGDIQIFV
jgi:hypothetical protein